MAFVLIPHSSGGM